MCYSLIPSDLAWKWRWMVNRDVCLMSSSSTIRRMEQWKGLITKSEERTRRRLNYDEGNVWKWKMWAPLSPYMNKWDLHVGKIPEWSQYWNPCISKKPHIRVFIKGFSPQGWWILFCEINSNSHTFLTISIIKAQIKGGCVLFFLVCWLALKTAKYLFYNGCRDVSW